jgi:hypothetical protein
VQEWLNWLVSKTSEPATVPRVRIPPSPPFYDYWISRGGFGGRGFVSPGVGLWCGECGLGRGAPPIRGGPVGRGVRRRSGEAGVFGLTGS